MFLFNLILILCLFSKNCLNEIPRIQSNHSIIGHFRALNMIGCGYVSPKDEMNYTYNPNVRDVKGIHTPIPVPNTRIINGTVAEFGDFPWQATLHHKFRPPNRNQLCDGILIHRLWVMTARHCVDPNITHYFGITDEPEIKAHELFVSFGTIDITNPFMTRNVSLILRHPNIDLALLQLQIEVTPVKSPDNSYYRINPICMPQIMTLNVNPELAIVSGSGTSMIWYQNKTKPPFNTLLRKSIITISGVRECERIRYPLDMICSVAIVNMTCHGDSGSGLIQFEGNRAILIGMVLGGRSFNLTDPKCSPGIIYFLRTSYYIRFLRDIIEFGIRGPFIFHRPITNETIGRPNRSTIVPPIPEVKSGESPSIEGNCGNSYSVYIERIISLFIINYLIN